MALNQYITDEQYRWVLEDLNYAISPEKKRELLDRATGDLEADLAQKFVVPLVAASGSAYTTAPPFARNKILNLMKSKIREIIGYDQNRNLTGTIESTEKFINVHGIEYKSQVKDVLNPKIDFGFLLLDYAQDAQTPVQHIGLARSPDSRHQHRRRREFGDW